MKYKKSAVRIGTFIALLTGLFFTQSCKKTQYEQLLKPYNEIQRFTIRGYGSLDSVNAVIDGEEIIVYWSADTEAPATIKPSISVSSGASISPASEEEVPFSETTTYTVTAEDGTEKVYTLKPVFNEAIPVLFSTPTVAYWAATTPISIVGEYFLSAGDASAIKIYAQRIRDGFEFEIPFDTAAVTSTMISANLPILTSELDTGAHRLYVKVGDFESNSFDIRLITPQLSTITESIIMDKPGEELTLGDELTFKLTYKEGWEDAGKRFFTQENTSSFSIGTGPLAGGNGSSRSVTKDYLAVKDGNTLTFKLAPEIFGSYVNHYIGAPIFRLTAGGQYQTTYSLGTDLGPVIRAADYVPGMAVQLVQEDQQLIAGQEITINYSFNDAATRMDYENRTMRNISLNLIKEENGVFTGDYASINVATADIADDGRQIKFTIPESASDYVGYKLKNISFSLRITGARYVQTWRFPVEDNTVIASN